MCSTCAEDEGNRRLADKIKYSQGLVASYDYHWLIKYTFNESTYVQDNLFTIVCVYDQCFGSRKGPNEPNLFDERLALKFDPMGLLPPADKKNAMNPEASFLFRPQPMLLLILRFRLARVVSYT